MAVDAAASALGSLRDVRPLTSTAGGVGTDDFDLWGWNITGVDGWWTAKTSPEFGPRGRLAG